MTQIKKMGEWNPAETAPKDGTTFYIRQITPARFLPYKGNSEQARKGIKGRWQVMNEYGGWDNAEIVFEEWCEHSELKVRT